MKYESRTAKKTYNIICNLFSRYSVALMTQLPSWVSTTVCCVADFFSRRCICRMEHQKNPLSSIWRISHQMVQCIQARAQGLFVCDFSIIRVSYFRSNKRGKICLDLSFSKLLLETSLLISKQLWHFLRLFFYKFVKKWKESQITMETSLDLKSA